MPLEIDDNGLEIMTLDEAREWMAGRIQAALGDQANVGSLSFIGQVKDIAGEAFHLTQEALLDLYAMLDPNSATGVWLDRLGALIGSTRRDESYSTVDGLLTFSGAGTVSDGDLIRHTSQETLWEAIDGPYTALGPDVIAATFRAVEPGPLSAIAGSAWELVTTVAGLDSFTNPTEDATPGRDQESDPDYRKRQTIERYGQGQGPTSSISAIVQKVNTSNGRVDTVRTYHNPLHNPTDSEGLPWKKTHVIVETTPAVPTSALEQDIFDALWRASGAGCHYHGSIAGTVTDSEGTSQPVAFDLVTVRDLYIVVNIDTANTLAVDGPVIPKDSSEMADIVHAAVHAAAQVYATVGRDPTELDYRGAVFQQIVAGNLSGIGNVDIQLSTATKGGPYSSPFVAISRDEKIEVDTVNIRIVIDGTTVIA